MRHGSLAFAMLLSLPLLAACDDATAPGGLHISAAMEQIAIANTDDETVYTFVMDDSHLPFVDWMPCVREECGRILAGDTRMLTYDQLQTGPGQRVRVYFWRAEVGPADEPIPGPVSVRIIRLPTGQLLR
jgi:hypothetical protein